MTSDGAGIAPKTQAQEYYEDAHSDGSVHDDEEEDDEDGEEGDDASSSDSEDDEMARSIRSSEGFARMPGSVDDASPASGGGSLPRAGPSSYAFTRPTPIAAIAEKYRQRGWSDTSSASEQEWSGATPMSLGPSPMAMMTPENMKFMMREKRAPA